MNEPTATPAQSKACDNLFRQGWHFQMWKGGLIILNRPLDGQFASPFVSSPTVFINAGGMVVPCNAILGA